MKKKKGQSTVKENNRKQMVDRLMTFLSLSAKSDQTFEVREKEESQKSLFGLVSACVRDLNCEKSLSVTVLQNLIKS